MNTSNIVPGAKKRRSLLILQLFIVAVLLATVWVSFGQNVLSPSEHPGAPEQLAGMKLDRFVEGAQALAQVNQLHGTSIELANAYIADYSHDFNPYHGDNAKVTAWVGIAESSDAARELLMRMTEGITRSNTGFSNLQRLTVAGYEILRVDGPGGEHFFYNSGEARVVWLTIRAGDAMLILEQAVRSF